MHAPINLFLAISQHDALRVTRSTLEVLLAMREEEALAPRAVRSRADARATVLRSAIRQVRESEKLLEAMEDLP